MNRGNTAFIQVCFAFSIKNDSQRGRVSTSSLSKTIEKLRLTNLSKEPYITFSVRTTSPTTVCRYSSGTLKEMEKCHEQNWINFSSAASQIFAHTARSQKRKTFFKLLIRLHVVLLENQILVNE